jgi:hypothetical protein
VGVVVDVHTGGAASLRLPSGRLVRAAPAAMEPA